jgi:hypothetical protein
MTAINLGDRVRYKINGFTGIVTGTCQYLYQCDQVYVKPERLDKDGQEQEGHWYDVPWVELIDARVHKPQGAVEVKGKRVNGAPGRDHPSMAGH